MKINFILFFIFFTSTSSAQVREYQIFRTLEEVIIDGDLEENFWDKLPTASNFTQTYPTDSTKATSRTDVKLCYDNKFLYISAVCYNNGNSNYVVNSFVRDFSFPRTDAFAIFLSPLKDETNGLSFSVNPFNVQRDGLVSNAGAFGVTTAWNQKWFSAVKRYQNYWTLEMALPLSVLKYKKNSTEWDINFARNDLKVNETSTWNPVPNGYNVASINYYGNLVWKEDLPKAKANISFAPFFSAGVAYVYEKNKTKDIKNLSRLGIDTKIGVTSTLDLDITINPDFSNTEVDAQVINLDRFSLFLPEKRMFFTENSDLFSRFGFSKIRPFFSRRIGLESNILGGLRLSGNLTKGLRIGLMNIQTEGTNDSRQLESQNFAVVAFRQKVFKTSNIGGIFVNKQAFNGFKMLKGQSNALAGIDFDIRSKNNKWNGKVFYHQGLNNKLGISNSANAMWLRFYDNKWIVNYNHEFVGESYDAEVGFVPRQGYFRFEHSLGRNFYVKNSKIDRHQIVTSYSQYWEKGAVSTDRENIIEYEIRMINSSKFGLEISNQQTKLSRDFDLVRKGTPINAGNYIYTSGYGFYNSNYRKAFVYRAGIGFGQFYNGSQLFMRASLDYNFRPRASVGLNFTRNELRFPKGYHDGFFTLIGTQFKVSFNTDVHWFTFLQYNTQANNFNINSRLQWRFAPMSDIFLSYTDNYDEMLNQKNRALVLRINWWFGL